MKRRFSGLLWKSIRHNRTLFQTALAPNRQRTRLLGFRNCSFRRSWLPFSGWTPRLLRWRANRSERVQGCGVYLENKNEVAEDHNARFCFQDGQILAIQVGILNRPTGLYRVAPRTLPRPGLWREDFSCDAAQLLRIMVLALSSLSCYGPLSKRKSI
jgi:hypothetical protein